MSGKLEQNRPSPGARCFVERMDRRTTSATIGWCATESLITPTGVISVLWVVGDVDLNTISTLKATLASAIDRRPMYLVVDLTRLRFCSAQGMSVLFRVATVAAEWGFGYAISNVPPRLDRIWNKLWPDELPTRYRNIITAIATIRD